MKQPKRHIYLDDFEWRVAINGLNEFRNRQMADQELQTVLDSALFQHSFRLGARVMMEIMEESA